jgi:type I restriction enzyme S subunit
MEGSINRRGGLRWDEFSKIKIHIPGIAEQNAIDEIFITVDKEIDLLKHKLEAMKQQKKGLMQVLLTGKIRVKVK